MVTAIEAGSGALVTIRQNGQSSQRLRYQAVSLALSLPSLPGGRNGGTAGHRSPPAANNCSCFLPLWPPGRGAPGIHPGSRLLRTGAGRAAGRARNFTRPGQTLGRANQIHRPTGGQYLTG